MDRNKLINLNKSKGVKSKLNTSIKTNKAQTVWKSNAVGFDVLNKHYGYDTKRVLDVGCRVGVFVYFLTEMGYDVVGIEIVPEFVKDAKSNGLNVYEQDARNIEFDDDTFDAVFCRDMIEHVPDPEKVFAESIRVVKPGGVIFLVGPIEPTPSALSHLVAFKTLDIAKRTFSSNLVRSVYFGLIEEEPVTNAADKKMIKQSQKRETFLAFLEVIK